jgi:predicted enzyme related to lactoylglutathione lyase
MPERDGYIPGVPCWADTSQPDPDAAAAFYRDVFGWEIEDVMPPESEGKYLIGRIRGGDVAAISSLPEDAPPRATWNTYVWVDSADESAAKVAEAGGTALVPPFNVMDAGRMAVFADLEGAVFSVWEARQHKGSRVVNEPGSVNFNGLHTRDVEAAKAFYGHVFGWETLTLDSGAEMWTLPGYGDYLERDSPGLRERAVSMGAQAEFVDVVANITPIPDGQADHPAHWDVTFATDDADALAEKAAALGGRVIVPPFDAPWSRMTVITDPQGATFNATKFVPENKDVAIGGHATASAA